MEKEAIHFNHNEKYSSIIKVIGAGRIGTNAVNHMFNQGILGVEFVICDAKRKLSPIERLDAIKNMLQQDTRMIFIIAGMGERTGSSAASEIAKLAKDMGILTIGIVTVPFNFEGKRKIKQAMDRIDELEQHIDALLIIANEKLREIHGDLKLLDPFTTVNNVLTIAAKSIAEIITVKGYVNVDFADVESVMRNSGVALMGAAEAEGENRAIEALNNALISPLLNSNDIRGASNILLNILHGDKELTMDEIALITGTLYEKVGKDVDVIWGAGEDKTLEDRLRVVVIATGVKIFIKGR